MIKIKQIDHTADVGFFIEASTLNELFKAAAIETFNVMTNLKKIKSKITKKINNIKSNKNTTPAIISFVEKLLANWST